jgi:hypothetical protein
MFMSKHVNNMFMSTHVNNMFMSKHVNNMLMSKHVNSYLTVHIITCSCQNYRLLYGIKKITFYSEVSSNDFVRSDLDKTITANSQ